VGRGEQAPTDGELGRVEWICGKHRCEMKARGAVVVCLVTQVRVLRLRGANPRSAELQREEVASAGDPRKEPLWESGGEILECGSGSVQGLATLIAPVAGTHVSRSVY
jgi:hypothetical protein